MKNETVFIADADTLHVENLCRILSRTNGFSVVGTQSNGATALREIQKLRPDVLITDIQLPGLEGTALLESACGRLRNLIGIVCTRFYSEMSVASAYRSGAAYVLYKPIDYERLPPLIALCCAEARRRERPAPAKEPPLEARIARALDEAGVSPRLAGRDYLMRAMLSLSRDRTLLRNLSKGLYAEIAARSDVAPACVERSMRNAIESAYARGALGRRFAAKPTNKAFIEYLLDRIHE